jgi:hypothetical protein
MRNYLVIPELVRAGHGINHQDSGGWSLLHLATHTSFTREVLDCLFQLGADIHLKGLPPALYWTACHTKSGSVLPLSEHTSTPYDLVLGDTTGKRDRLIQAATRCGILLQLDLEGDLFFDAIE